MPLILPTNLFKDLPWFHPYIEARERIERHMNPTFSGAADASQSDLLNRYRLGASFDIKKDLDGVLEYQNATDLYWTHSKNGMTQNSDVTLAYADYSTKRVDYTLGRQKIELGDQRLIGSTEWTVLSRSFDVLRMQSGPWDLWGGTLGVANHDTADTRLTVLTHQNDSYGTSSIIYKHDEAALGAIDEETLDHFVKHKFGNTTLDAEGALQGGEANLQTQEAWAYHVRATQLLLRRLSLSVEADSASGGSPTSSTSRTFDNLYPSNHDLYGLADTTGWRNMDYLAARIEARPTDAFAIRGTAQTISLQNPHGDWFNYSGVPNVSTQGVFVDPTGKSGSHVGDEFDLEAAYKFKHLGSLTTGIALFDPGDFVKNVSGHGDPETFFYFQWQAKF
jgi:Alginate export